MEKTNFLSPFRARTKTLIYKAFRPKIIPAHSLSLRAFLDLLTIEPVNALKENGRLAQAENALIDYYRCRKNPSWPAPPGIINDLRLNLEEITDEELIHRAESILKFEFLPGKNKPLLTSKREIEWNRNPISSPEWLWRLNRHQWWPVLGLAYRLTGDERYAIEFVNQMISWVRENPPPKVKDEKNFAWRLMEAGMRLQVSWIPAFGLFFNSPSFTNSAKIKMLRCIYDHAEFLAHFKTSQNHLLRESNGLAAVGVYFPEFKKSKRWLKIARLRLEGELEKQINPDGFHFELSTGYQWVAIDEFEKAYELLNSNHLLLPSRNLEDRLKKMYRVLVYLVRPDGTFPELNDGFLRWSYRRLAGAGKRFRRPDFTYIGTRGKQGIIPRHTSLAFKNAGYYVMRSDWSQDAKYLCFDAGPYGGYHGHEDKLSIEVFAYGTAFIVDSGSYTYENTDPFRDYFVGSQGHNTIMVDACSQIRRWTADGTKASKSTQNSAIWLSNSNFDYAAGVYKDGYAKFALKKPIHPDIVDDVTHTRHILFVKPDYWLLVDELNAQELHNYQMLFHGHPELEVRIQPQKAVTLKNGKNACCLFLIPAERENIQVNLKTGCQAPIQGWYSLDHHFKTPSTAIVYERKNIRSAVMTTLLYPVRAKCSQERILIQPLEVSDRKGVAYKIMTGQGTDYLMISSHSGLKKFDDYRSFKMIAGIRTDKNGQIKAKFEG